MPRYLARRGLTLSLNRWWNFVGRVGANGAASWEFYGILNAAGGLSRFAACDTGSFPERRMALFESESLPPADLRAANGTEPFEN